MRRSAATVTALLAVLMLTLATGCSSSSSSGNAPASQGADTSNRKVIEITFSGGTVTPIAEQVNVNVGQTVVLDITADTAGEIHVHSTPEQHVEYGVGHTQVPLNPLTIPGTIEVESHSLKKTILILQVQ
jgi:ABC-type phosphate transport system substrate-binding protein